MKAVYIYDAIRSARARAKPDGGLHELMPQELLRQLYSALESRTGLNPAMVGDVVLGCVTQQGDQAGNIAKNSTLYSGWPESVPGLTVNRFCSSGIDAINIAMLKIAGGQARAAVAGGVEMMSRVPMLADQATIFTDPAFAAQCKILMMGSGADLIASKHDVSREVVDAIALESQQRAAHARSEGYFTSIVPVENSVKGITIAEDECIRPNVTASSLAEMPAAFAELGAAGVDGFQLASNNQLAEIRHVHTAGNSPAMADAAAITLLGDESLAQDLHVRARAKIVAATTSSGDALEVLSGCNVAVQKLLTEQGLSVADIDLFEVHEAFAATIAALKKTLGIAGDKLNVNGGVIALGHPMGATGAIMAGTLLDELERRGQRLGVVSAAGAAGSGAALLIECCA